jgi:putative nucleotidyltransferase with HDIG domain
VSEPSGSAGGSGTTRSSRAELAKAIPRRPRVTWWLVLALAGAFAVLITPMINAERIFLALGAGRPAKGFSARMTVRVPPFTGYETRRDGLIGGVAGFDRDGACGNASKVCGGIAIARGDVAEQAQVDAIAALDDSDPGGFVPYIAYFLLAGVLAALFAHHIRRSTYGRLVRVQVISLALVLVTAVAVKALRLGTSISVLAIPVALFAMLPTLALDRVVGLATGTLAALVVALLVPVDVGVIVVLLVQAGTAGLVIAERPKLIGRAVVTAGALSTLLSALTYPLLVYLMTWQLPLAELRDPLHSAWVAAAFGPALATALAVPLLAVYQLMVGEITHGKLVALEDLSQPLLRQIAEKAPGTWQHSLMMANMAELAANAIGANGRLVRVGAYYHDLGKSLQPKYFIENLEPGETSPHDQLPPQVSCDAIFAHVSQGIATARRAGLHDRIVDFMHMHHGNGVLEYFWAKCREQGNPDQLAVESFRYPGVPPQSRETAILAICDAVEAASRTLKKPEPAAIETLVQRIVYGKLHLGQLDDSGLSMGDLRRVTESLRETIKHANHGRIEYPWQKAGQDASAGAAAALEGLTSTGPRLDSLDRPAKPDPVRPAPRDSQHDALAATGAQATPKLRVGKLDAQALGLEQTAPQMPEGPRGAKDTVIGVGASTPAADLGGTASAAMQFDAAAVAAAADIATPAPPTASPRKLPPPPPRPSAPAVEQFAAEAKETLDEIGKDHAAPPKAAAPPDTGARTRAATIPPVRGLAPPPKTTLAGPLVGKLPARTAGLDESATTQPRMPRASSDDDTTDGQDDTQPRFDLPLLTPLSTLAERIDAQLDDNFGTDTPVSAPTKAELQAITGAAPDPTRVATIEELERLKGNARRSDRDIDGRSKTPTAEVEESDIEADIELAPPARRTGAIGVVKKKSE